MENNLFGEVIYSYSRAQAIEDGALVDVTAQARETGICLHTAITRAAWDLYVAVPPCVRCQDERGRLHDVLWMLFCAIRDSGGVHLTFVVPKRVSGSVVLYSLHVRNTNRRGIPPLVQLKAVCGPGDDAAPVITIMLPEED